MKILFSLAAGMALCVSLGCHGGGDGSGREDAPLREWDGLVLDAEVWRVGAFGGPEHQAFGRISGAVFVDHELVVSDAVTRRVHWYGERGAHVSSMGGGGRGPGEFVEPRGIAALTDGSIAVVNIGGNSLERFNRKGEFLDRVTLPGLLQDVCALDHRLIALGVVGDSDAALHLLDPLKGDSTRSIGRASGGNPSGPHRERLLGGLIQGAVECRNDSVVYARSSEGSISMIDLAGDTVWSFVVPRFIPMVHEPGSGGVRHGPAEGAREMHGFAGIWHMDGILFAQVWRVDVEEDDVTLYTVFLDATSGDLMGFDEQTPLILAVGSGRIAVASDAVVPTVMVYSASVVPWMTTL